MRSSLIVSYSAGLNFADLPISATACSSWYTYCYGNQFVLRSATKLVLLVLVEPVQKCMCASCTDMNVYQYYIIVFHSSVRAQLIGR